VKHQSIIQVIPRDVVIPPNNKTVKTPLISDIQDESIEFGQISNPSNTFPEGWIRPARNVSISSPLLFIRATTLNALNNIKQQTVLALQESNECGNDGEVVTSNFQSITFEMNVYDEKGNKRTVRDLPVISLVIPESFG